jgi:hypothetical protein
MVTLGNLDMYSVSWTRSKAHMAGITVQLNTTSAYSIHIQAEFYSQKGT